MRGFGRFVLRFSAHPLRASGIARGRAEEERAEVLFLGERRGSSRIPSARREQRTGSRKRRRLT
jgi:hypothetical protein